MIESIKNMWKIVDLRKKILFTLAMIVIYRLGAYIPVPGIDVEVIRQYINQGALLGFLDVMSGGALNNFSIFAMGISPYINASIILTLLTIAIPALERISKEGVEGRKKISQYTRYLTVVLGLVQAIGLTIGLRSAMIEPGWTTYIIMITTLTAGTAFIMWLGEQITDKGVGNGISIIIFASVVSTLPSMFVRVFSLVAANAVNIFLAIAFVVFAIVTVVGIVFITQGQRKIPVQYAKRVVGRKMYGGQSTFIPLKVNQSGVIPVIFASSLLLFPVTIAGFFPSNGVANAISNFLDPSGVWYSVIYVLLIIAFTYFYTSITFNPIDMADNMKQNGGFIPGVRPGKPTSSYLMRVMNRVTLVGGAFLALVAIVPNFLFYSTSLNIAFGGTSLLIAIGVALETMKQIESQMTMRHYKGFMK